MLRERDPGLAKSRRNSSFSTGRTAGTLVRVPSANRRPEATPATDAQILRRAVALVVLIFVVGGALLVGSVLSGGPDRPAKPGAAPSRSPATVAETTSSAPRASASATPTLTNTPKPKPQHKPQHKPQPKPTASGMQRFVTGYLATVARDPVAGWTLLTPSFRNASGGFGSYSRFWNTVTRAVPRDVVADPRGLTIGYTVDYTRRDGSTSVDSTRLRLVFRGGDYLIDGEG
jgi:hypothetical protein